MGEFIITPRIAQFKSRLIHSRRADYWLAGTLPIPSFFTKAKKLRISWHSNRHAPRNTKERKVRSKIRWFTEFCNSHYLSHFAAFFIDARAKRSVVESCISLIWDILQDNAVVCKINEDEGLSYYIVVAAPACTGRSSTSMTRVHSGCLDWDRAHAPYGASIKSHEIQ